MKEVTREELKPGREYYIEGLTEDENKNRVSLKPPYKMIATFSKLENNDYFLGFKFALFTNFRRTNTDKTGYNVKLSELWKFYEKSADLIQQRMEERACDLLLQKIIGDEHFTVEFI